MELREALKKKKSQKVEKVHNFLDPPPLPQDDLDFFEFGKNLKFDAPPPVPNLGKISNWENFESSEPPLKYGTLSLKHLKLPKNHFKTDLFFF